MTIKFSKNYTASYALLAMRTKQGAGFIAKSSLIFIALNGHYLKFYRFKLIYHLKTRFYGLRDMWVHLYLDDILNKIRGSAQRP